MAFLWLCLSELCQLTYCTNPIRHLLTDEFLLMLSWAYRCAPLCLPFYTVMLMSVSLNTSFTLSVLFGFAISHHFFLFGKKPKSGPRVLRIPYYLISVVWPVPPVSLENRHCFAVDATRRHVIIGWTLRTKRAIATGSPCVIPSAQWQDLFIASDKLIIVSTS